MAKIKSVEDYEMEGYDLPEIEVVAKNKSKPQTYTHTPTAAEVYDGELTTAAQTYVPTSEESTVVETKTREPRVRRQRDVNFGEGLAKIASVMGIGQGDGRDRVAAREQRAAERRERQEARQDARQARQEVRDARQDARQAVRDERQALRDVRVAENRENRLNAQQVRRDARDVARMEREQSRLDARQVRQEERDAARQVRVDDRLARRDERVQSRLDRAKERAARVEEIARRRGAREAARVEAENTRDANREARRTERANDRAARQERVDANRAARENARVERQEMRDERREARVADREAARQERVEGKPQGLSRLEAPTNDAPTEVAVPSDKAPAAKAYGVTTIEEPNVQRRPSGEGGTTAEQREITDAEAREMRGYVGGESAAANGQGAERKVTYIEEPNVQRRPVANEDELVTEDKPISDEEARKIRGYGNGTAPESEGGYEDPYKDAYEYKQKLSNEIDYSDNAKRAEMERAHQEWLESDPYRNSDEFKVQLTDDITAKTAGSTAGTETTEKGDGTTTTTTTTEGGGATTATEGGGEPQGGNGTTTTESGNGTEGGNGDDDSKLSDAEWYKKYFGIDEEEIARQKKAAKWAVAAQMLADSIGALSNVYWTGKGADAMKFEPGAPKAAAAANKMYADIREAREKALKAALDEREKQFERAYRAERDRKQDEKDAKTFDANEAHRKQQQNNFEKTEARLAEQARLNAENERIRIDIAKQNANIQLKNALDKNKPYPMVVNGEIYEIPIKKINEQIVGSIFAKLPEEVRMSAGSPRYGKDAMNNSVIVGYDNPSLADMLAAIGTYGNEETAKEIMKLAGVKVEEVDPKKEERGKENTSTNNPEPPVQAYSAPADEWSSQWRRRAGLDTTDFSQFKRK